LGVGDGDGVFVDIEAKVELIHVHGVGVVRVHLTDQNASAAPGGDDVADKPTRATCDKVISNRMAFCDPQPYRMAAALQP